MDVPGSVSSVVEHFVHTEGVVGSNPIPTTSLFIPIRVS